YDFPLAERLVAGAVEGGAGFAASVLAAQIATLQGRPQEADRQLALLSREAQTDEERARVAGSRMDALALRLGRMEEGPEASGKAARPSHLGHKEDGLEVAPNAEAQITDPIWRDEVTARRAVIVFALDGPGPAAEVSLPLLARATGPAFVWASMIAAFSLPRL